MLLAAVCRVLGGVHLRSHDESCRRWDVELQISKVVDSLITASCLAQGPVSRY